MPKAGIHPTYTQSTATCACSNTFVTASTPAAVPGLVGWYRRYAKLGGELADNKVLLEEEGPEMRAMAREEMSRLTDEQGKLAERMKLLLLPRDPNDDKNILLEIRGGTGGEE